MQQPVEKLPRHPLSLQIKHQIRRFWHVLSPDCGRYQLDAGFFNTLASLELPSIGWQLFILDSSQSDPIALPAFLDTYATRLLTEPLIPQKESEAPGRLRWSPVSTSSHGPYLLTSQAVGFGERRSTAVTRT